MNIIFLEPLNTNQKSFYKKAYVTPHENGYSLTSYTTTVAEVVNNEDGSQVLYLPWGAWSSTTGKHVWEFILQYAPSFGKAYLELPSKSFADFMRTYRSITIDADKNITEYTTY